jgi:AraC-like DNA-binding protein
MNQLFYFAAGGALIQSLVLGLLILRPGSGRGLASHLLMAILVAASLNILHALTIFSAAGDSHRLLVEPLQFALPPLFAAYVKALLAPGFRLRPIQLLHFAPASLAIVLSLGLVLVPGMGDARVRALSIWLWIALLLQALAYLRVAMRDIARYREGLKAEVSNLEGVDPAWLRWFSWVLHGIYLLYTLVPFLLLHLPSLQSVRNFISLVLSLSVSLLCYRQVLGKVPLPREAAETRRSYAEELPRLLERLMEEEKLYLRSELDLGALAARLGWPRNEVSAAINGGFGLNFYDFVNGYRVREVKALMEDPERGNLTLFALALEAGFNSKPTFNAVFKKQVGCTPSEYFRRCKLV